MLRSDLDHLPARIRRELDYVVRVLFEESADALKDSGSERRRAGRVLKVILFGSFAKGGWVEDRASGYMSDYDLLVVVNHEDLTDFDYWESAEDRFVREETITHRIKRPVTLVVHSLADVNDQLGRGRPFFIDIVRDGIALYEAPGHPLVKPQPLEPEAAHVEAQGYYDDWFESAGRFLINAKEDAGRGWSKEAAFLLHQTVERLYHCTLLVLTLYSPKLHNIGKLRALAEALDPSLAQAWPRGTRFERRAFDRIRRAYVEARYSLHYKITSDEFAWAAAHAEQLMALVRDACEARLGAPAAGDPAAARAGCV